MLWIEEIYHLSSQHVTKSQHNLLLLKLLMEIGRAHCRLVPCPLSPRTTHYMYTAKFDALECTPKTNFENLGDKFVKIIKTF